jgi:CRP/FNR family cyclic AMP-dependent transcriptional regulator
MNETKSPETLRKLVAAHPFCVGLSVRHIDLLAAVAAFERFGPAESLFREGQPAEQFYLINKGGVVLETFVPRTGTVTLQTINAGSALGWSWLYPPYQWQFTAVVTEPVEAIAFSASGLRRKAEENHDFGYELLLRVGRLMLETLQGTRRRLVEFYVRDLVE